MSATFFYWLRQLRRVRRSRDSDSAVTLVNAFVTSRVDQCNAILAAAMKSVTDTLQRVMNAAACIVSETRKFDHGLTQILHNDLHWLDVADRVTYKLGVIMHRCQHGKAPQYLVDCCTPVTDVVGRQRLRSATQQMMVVPRHGFPLLATEHSPCKSPWSGTPCRTTSAHIRTMSPLYSA